MILPPLYYGMHRFQTLLRKRQQTLCLRSFLNDAVTACDPKKQTNKKKKTKKNKPKYRKLGSTVRKNTNSGFLGGCEGQGLEEKMDVVSSESLGLPVSLRVASMNTGLKKHSCDTFWFNVEATVQVTILDFFLLKVFFLFTSLQTKRPKTNKKPYSVNKTNPQGHESSPLRGDG